MNRQEPTLQELVDAIRQWGRDKGITGPQGKGTLLGQLGKTQEELDETRTAADLHIQGVEKMVRKGEVKLVRDELEDGIGDTGVTLILAAEMAGMRFEDCLLAAYNEIKGRTGTMVDGQFVKDSPPEQEADSKVFYYGPGRPEKYGFSAMEIGDVKQVPASEILRVRACAAHQKRNHGKLFSTRMNADGSYSMTRVK